MSVSSAESLQSSPDEFVIRPHHSLMIHSLLVEGYTPDTLAEIAQANAYNQALTFGEGNARRADYSDRYGHTDEQAEEFNGGAKAFLGEFLGLPDGARVKAAPELDAICQGCFIGDHCDKAIKTDSQFAHAIRATARARGIGERIAETEEPILLRSGEARVLPVQRMDASTAREIFGDKHYTLRTARTTVGYAAALAMRSVDQAVAKVLRRVA